MVKRLNELVKLLDRLVQSNLSIMTDGSLKLVVQVVHNPNREEKKA